MQKKNSLTNKIPQPCPLDCKSLLGRQTDRRTVWNLTGWILSGRDLTAIMHGIDLLLHSWEDPWHFTHLCTSVGMDTYTPGKPLRYAIYMYFCICMDLLLFVNVRMYVLEMPQALHISWITWLAMNIFKCVNMGPNAFPFCAHTYVHTDTAISDVLAECTRLFPVDKHGWDVFWSLGAESVFLSSCQGVTLTFSVWYF